MTFNDLTSFNFLTSSNNPPLPLPQVNHSHPSVLLFLCAPLLFLLPPLLLFLHLFLDVLQPLALLLFLLLLLHGRKQLLRAFHQRLVLCVNLFPGHHCGLEVRGGIKYKNLGLTFYIFLHKVEVIFFCTPSHCRTPGGRGGHRVIKIDGRATGRKGNKILLPCAGTRQ